MERVTPEKTFEPEPGSPDQAVFFDRLAGVLRAGRIISAVRPQQRGDRSFVEAEESQGETFHRRDFSRARDARKAAYCSHSCGHGASAHSARVINSMSRDIFNDSLFLRKSSRARRRALFRRTALPTFRLETAAIRGYPKPLER